MCGLLLLPTLDHCVWSPVLLIQCVDDQDWCSTRQQKRGGIHGFCAINMPPSWQSVHCCQLGVWSVEEQFTEREVYFSLNGTTNVKQRGRKWDFSSQPLLSNARSAEFSSMKVTKLCYEKYFVLVSNHNVIGSKDLKLVSNWFER
jgi:hypothetical protein